MSTPIDIYTYPENATPIQLAEYQLEVMRAAERGEPVEYSNTEVCPEWRLLTWEFAFLWSPTKDNRFRYRIARPKIAEGHNPDGLTEAQVGVQDGWRLLVAEEIDWGRELTKQIHEWHAGEWTDFAGGKRMGATYRTKNPPGHYLPKPAAEPVAETREETRRDRIATIVQLIWNRSEPADQIAARIEALLAREQSAPGLTFTTAREILGQ